MLLRKRRVSLDADDGFSPHEGYYRYLFLYDCIRKVDALRGFLRVPNAHRERVTHTCTYIRICSGSGYTISGSRFALSYARIRSLARINPLRLTY